MSFKSTCVSALALLATVAAALLFIMSHLLRGGNWTFEVLAAKHGWEREVKAKACMRGGLSYLLASLVLWIGLIFHESMERLWRRLFWNRNAEDEPIGPVALLLSNVDPEMCSSAVERKKVENPSTKRWSSGWGEEEEEMSALNWTGEAPRMETVGAFRSELFSTDSHSFTAARNSPRRRRFPDIRRSVHGMARGLGITSPCVNEHGSLSVIPLRSTVSDGTLACSPSREIQSLRPSEGVTGNGVGSRADTTDDADFMSDVDVDGTRHYTTLQVRTSSWGLRRAGVSSTRPRNYTHEQIDGDVVVQTQEYGHHARSDSAEALTKATPSSMLTNLWHTSRAGASLPESRQKIGSSTFSGKRKIT